MSYSNLCKKNLDLVFITTKLSEQENQLKAKTENKVNSLLNCKLMVPVM